MYYTITFLHGHIGKLHEKRIIFANIMYQDIIILVNIRFMPLYGIITIHCSLYVNFNNIMFYGSGNILQLKISAHDLDQ